MPRRSLLTPAERTGLLAFPTTDDEFIWHYTFSEPDLSAIRQRRGNPNRLGFAVQLCYLRYPGLVLPSDAEPPAPLLSIVSRQLRIEPDIWPQTAALMPRNGLLFIDLPLVMMVCGGIHKKKPACTGFLNRSRTLWR